MLDFSKMRWGINGLPLGESVFTKYPELQDMFKGVSEHLKKFEDDGLMSVDLLVRYIIYVYHLKSPLAINEQNIIKRKIDALKLLEIDPEAENILPLITNENKEANYIKLQFLKYENNYDWMELCQYTEVYYSIMGTLTDEKANQGNKGDVDIVGAKLKVIKDIKVIKNEIDALNMRVFKNDLDMPDRNYKGLNNFIASFLEEEKRVVILPEDYVFVKQQNASAGA